MKSELNQGVKLKGRQWQIVPLLSNHLPSASCDKWRIYPRTTVITLTARQTVEVELGKAVRMAGAM